MASGSNLWWNNAALEVALKATGFAFVVIVILIVFIWARRAYRNRLFVRRDQRAYEIRKNWDKIVSLEISPDTWRNDALDREIVETILLSQLDIAPIGERQPLLRCLRDSGLLDLRMSEAVRSRGWKRRSALSALGRTREPEAIGILAEALDSNESKEVTTAVRALGRIGVPAGAEPILEHLAEGRLNVPPVVLRTALVNCCRTEPSLLLKHYDGASVEIREVLARSVAELMSPALAEDLWLLAQDSSAEVRASVARALGDVSASYGAAALSVMTSDPVWFVRLRAVAALAGFKDESSIPILVRAVCDSNRLVRQRAAMALVQFEGDGIRILRDIVSMEDRYALHSYVSELQRLNKYHLLLTRLEDDDEYFDLLAALQRTQRDISLRMDVAETEQVDA